MKELTEKQKGFIEGAESMKAKVAELIEKEMKKMSIENIDGDEKYWNPEAFGYALNDASAPVDKFFPKEVKEKLLNALNKLTP